MKEKAKILVVGSNRTNLQLLTQQLDREGYETLSAASLEEFDTVIRGNKKIVLCLLDVSGFDQRIWERCEQLRKDKVPFIVISPQRSPTIQRDSMKHGASALLVKPIGIRDLKEFVNTLLGE